MAGIDSRIERHPPDDLIRVKPKPRGEVRNFIRKRNLRREERVSRVFHRLSNPDRCAELGTVKACIEPHERVPARAIQFSDNDVGWPEAVLEDLSLAEELRVRAHTELSGAETRLGLQRGNDN